MPSARWLNKRRLHWTRLTELVERAGRSGVRALSHKELQELGLLYRQAASDLAAVREDTLEGNLARSLNQLLARAHNLLYAGRGHSGWGIVTFYRSTFPRIFRETFPYTFAAFILFVMAALMGTLLCFHDPTFERYLLGPAMMESIQQHKMWTESVLTVQPLASSAIMTNNLSVAFATYAFGILAGVGTVYMLLLNGLMIGVVGVACYEGGMSGPLWSFVAPHGVLELPAIFIAGGAGFVLARGLLFPGLLPRRESLAAAGGESVRLVLGVIPLLLVAGTIEGFLSPTHIPPMLKYVFAASLFTMLLLYLFRAGYDEHDAEHSDFPFALKARAYSRPRSFVSR
jgi:uncharacterized membrane protein SpoIIM required for sporulation